MAINQFSHNSNEPLEVRDLNVSGTETIQNIRIGVASISSLSGTAVTYSTGNFGVLNANTINANGDLNIIGRLYDKTNRTGNSGEILVSTGSGVTWSTANSITIDDDNLTATNVFPTFVTVSAGVQTNVKVSSKRFVFNPLQGRVGVGTNLPADSFQVGTGFTVSDDGTVKALKYFGDGSNLTGLVPNSLSTSTATTPQFIGFSTTSSGVNTSFFASPRLVFTPGNSGVGSLGIGTTVPTNTLHVQGDVRITGALIDRLNSTGNNKFLKSTGTGIEWSDSSASVGVATTSSTATQFLTFVLGTGNTSVLGIGTAGSLSFQPSTKRLGVTSISLGGLFLDNDGFAGSANQALKISGDGTKVVWGPVVGSAAGLAATGPTGTVQFNDNGAFAGASFFNFDKLTFNVGIGTSTNITQKLIVQGNVNVSGVITANQFSGDGSKITGINTGSAAGSPGQVQFNKSGLTSGAQYFHFDDSRISVGIGTSVPTGRLSIANTSTGNSVLLVNDNLSDGTLFRVNDNSGSTLFDVDAGGTIIMPTSGNVGIGSTLLTPTSKLHVFGDAIITGILTARVAGSVTGAAGTTGQVQVNVGGAFTGAKYFHYDDARISVGIGTSVPTGRLSIASTSTGNSLLLVNDNLSDGTLFRVNDNSGSTLFDVDAGGTIVMPTTGNVGIGTTVLSPTSKLHVGGDVLVTGILTARMNEANVVNSVSIGSTANITGNAIVTGNVGIATTNPTSKLHVIGDAIITGILTARVAGTVTGAAGTSGQVQVNVGGAFTGAKYFHYDDARISVGIGTSVPTGRLSIANTSTGTSLLLVNDNISDGSLFRVADVNANLVFDTDASGTIIMPSTGNVGIGTTVLTPTSKLHVGGDVLVTGILTARMNEANILNNAIVSGNVGIATPNPTSRLHVVGDAIITGILTARVAGTVTGAAGTSGQVQVNVGGTFTGAKYFHYNDSTISVGIGTSVPSGRLSIASTSTGTSLLLVNDNINDGSLFRVADGNANLLFDVDSSGTIIMPTSGNVGIGTTIISPTSKLQVGGSMFVDGNAVITGILTARVSGTVTGAAGTTGQVQVNVGGAFTGAKYFHYNDSTVSVGIGTSVPTGRLSIANTSTGNSLLLVNDNLSDGSLFRVANSAGRILFDVDSGGSIISPAADRFGIGTFFPAQTFQVGSGKTAFVVSGVGSVGIGTDNPIYPLTVATNIVPSPNLSNVIADFTTSTNSFSQINTRNASNGVNASTDIIATANNGTDTTNFIDLGINNSGYSFVGWTINGPLDGYLYTSDTNLSIGAAQLNRYVSLFAGGTLASNEKLRANTTGVGIGTTNPQAALQVGTAFTVTSTGIVSALTYHGDGSNLKNITGAAGVANASVITSTATTPQFIGFSSVSSGLNTSWFVSTNLVYVPSGIGSLGIGTTNPTTTVTIGGTLSFPNNNIKIGDNSTGCSITSGTQNFFAGCAAGRLNTTGRYNNFFGTFAGCSNITGINNNYFGAVAGRFATSSNNNFFGFCAGANATGSYNNIFGFNAGCNLTSGAHNFFAGCGAARGTGAVINTGSNNIAIGSSSGLLLTSGSNNTFLGCYSGCNNTTGFNNTFIGFGAGRGSSAIAVTGSNNIGIGTSAGANLTSGSSNNFFGACAGLCNNSGANNNFFGRYSGCNNTTGPNNNFFGMFTGCSNTIGSNNNFFSNSSGASNISGNSNTFFGQSSGRANTIGSYNNFFGFYSGRCNTTGRYNNFFGFSAGCNNTTASSNTFIGFSAGRGVSGAITGSNNIGIGTSAGSNLTSGVDNTFIGRYAGCSNTTGRSNVAIGVSAGRNNFNGNCNNFIGDGAGRYNSSGCHNNFFGSMAGGGASGGSNNSGNYNNFFGACAGLCNNSGVYNNFFGRGAGRCNTGGFSNTYFGNCAGFCNSTNSANTMIGQCAGFFNNGTNNFFVGLQAGRDVNTGSSNVYFGSQAGQSNTSGSHNFMVGQFSGFSATGGSYNTFFGFGSGRNNTGSFNTFIGCNAGFCNTSGNNNTFIGAYSGCGGAGGITGSHNIGIGTQTGRSLTSGCHNTFLGRYAGRNTTGSFNNFVGAYAGCNATTGSCNIFEGFGAGRGLINPVTGSSNIAIGSGAGANLTGGTYNTFFGRLAGCTNTLGSSNVIIGCNAQGSSATVSNEVTISNGTNFARFQGAASAWTFTSDQRDKTNIQDLTIGRDFLRNIKPRKFEWNHRNNDNDIGKEASGFIAQEVLEIVEQFNVPYTNLVDTNDENQYTLGTTNLIPIMVNAIKELDFENRELKNRILEIERRVGISSGS